MKSCAVDGKRIDERLNKLESKRDEIASLFKTSTPQISKKCEICTSTYHYTDECPNLVKLLWRTYLKLLLQTCLEEIDHIKVIMTYPPIDCVSVRRQALRLKHCYECVSMAIVGIILENLLIFHGRSYDDRCIKMFNQLMRKELKVVLKENKRMNCKFDHSVVTIEELEDLEVMTVEDCQILWKHVCNVSMKGKIVKRLVNKPFKSKLANTRTKVVADLVKD
ncbi:hypothetical protein V8G54_033273 [Vigna mungo]|uniref:Uncharacterized protein n=1 Tax=Vigna mungo TaxID=3915 RepID=A0AAQ3MNP3_VIGMU